MRRSAIRKVDAAVVGGGPAGAATALALGRLGYSAIVIERTYYDTVRIGETLPPKIRPLLVSLGVWEEFLSQNHCRSFATHSAWGQAELYTNDFIFNPYGSGWHVDRALFDMMLTHAAEDVGVHVLRGAQLISLQERDGNGWRVEIGAERKQFEWDAQFVVDATGRASTIAGRQGAIRMSCDHLIGIVAFFACDSRGPASNNATLVEAVEDGWWYSALLPDGRVVVAFMTDADIYARASKKSRYFWSEELRKTGHTNLRLYARTANSVPQVVSANSSHLDQGAGKNWLAVGDAAMAFDPLSSQGVYNALMSGLLAAQAIESSLAGDHKELHRYAVAIENNFAKYLVVREKYYRRETRWPNSPFWKRRRGT